MENQTESEVIKQKKRYSLSFGMKLVFNCYSSLVPNPLLDAGTLVQKQLHFTLTARCTTVCCLGRSFATDRSDKCHI